MTLAFPYEIRIPSQGLLRSFADKSQLDEFVEEEASFFRETASLISGNFVYSNNNYGELHLSNNANRFFGELRSALAQEDLQPFDHYVEKAQDLRILVAQGRFGQRIRDLIKGDGQEEARWIALILCAEWTDGEPDKIIARYRAAFLAYPISASYGDLIATSDALNHSKMALAASELSKHDLNAFIHEKTNLFDKLEELYRSKLTLDEPAITWEKIALRKTAVWSSWLAIFAVLVMMPIGFAVWDWPAVSESVVKLTAGASGTFSVAGLAIITVPALFYAWLLKNISRVFIQNLNLADDAAHRRSLALTYLGLLQDEKHPASDQDRAIILNALFRPIPPQTADEGPPAGVLDLIRSKA